MIKGFDALGLAHPKYDIKTIIQAVPKDWAIGFFDHPFGNAAPKHERLVAAGYRIFRPQLWWADDHKIAPIDHTKKQAKKWGEIAERFKDSTFYLSHSCEYDARRWRYTQADVATRVKILKDYAPANCLFVDSVMAGPTSGIAIPEHHGDTTVGRGEIISTDGINHYDINAEAWANRNAQALIQFVWGARENLREIPDPGQKVPKPKDRNAAPSLKYNLSLVRLLSSKNTVVTDIKGEEFLKTHAEDDQEPNPSTPDEPRENRPIFASKIKAKKAAIIASNGVTVGYLIAFGSLINGCTRYYAGLPGGINLYGYEIANKAFKLSGSEIVSIKVGQTVYRNINFAFREGKFRKE